MRFFLVSLILFAWRISVAQQERPGKAVTDIKFDSCHLTVYRVVTREMITITGAESKKELQQVRLSTYDATMFLKKISRRASYKTGRAALTHHNLVFYFYRDGSENMDVTVSSITGNIDINNPGIDQKFHGILSRKMGRHILNILATNNLMGLIDHLDLGGLRQTTEY